MKRDEALSRLRRQAPALRAVGVRGLSLFGSTARDEAGPESDIDVLVDVDFDANPRFGLLALIGVQHSLADQLGQPVHATFNGPMTEALRASIARDAIDVF